MRRRYSQWDWSAMRYNYFEGPEPADPGGFEQLRGVRQEEPPRHDGGVLGVDIDAVLRPLPSSARLLGVGPLAIGEVVRSTRAKPNRLAPPAHRRGAVGLGVVGAEELLDTALDSMVAATGGTQVHPGITVQALDHPPFAVAATSGFLLGFGLGRAFGDRGRVFAWGVAALFGLMAAGARRKAFVAMVGPKAATSRSKAL